MSIETTSTVLNKEYSLLQKGIRIKKKIINETLYITLYTDKLNVRESIEISNITENTMLQLLYKLEKQLLKWKV